MSNPPPTEQSSNSPTDPSSPPTDQSNTDQPYNPSSDPFIEYSRSVYEYTLDQWWRMRRAEEERIASLFPHQPPEYYLSVQIQSVEGQEQQQQPQNPDAPLDPSSEGGNDRDRVSEPRPLDTKSEEDTV